MTSPPSRHNPTPAESRWERFLARNAFVCPHCGYDMHGLRSVICPECKREIDIQTAMSVGVPISAAATLLGSAGGVLLVASLNLAMILGAQFGLHPLACTQYKSHPPLAYYGVLTLRLCWFFAFGLGISVWWLNVRGARPEEDDARRAMSAGRWLAILATVAHAVWLALRIGFAA